MLNNLNYKVNLKIVKSLIIFLGLYICVLSGFFMMGNFKNYFSKKVLADTGSYIFTAISATGTTQSAVGGNVQINGGTVSGIESGQFNYRESITIQAYAKEGYEFAGWYSAVLGGQLKTRSELFTFYMPSENTTYYAIFTVNRYDISVTSSPLGAGNITGGGTYDYNSEVSLLASAVNDNYQFYRWIENGSFVSSDPSYFFTVSKDRNLIAEFKVKVTVQVSGQGSVLVNAVSGFTSDYFLQTDNIILEAVADEGSEFVGWSSASVSSSPTLQILVGTTPKTYVANFELIGAYLFVNATEGGSLDGTSPSGTYAEGDIINLVALASENYHFLYWEGEVSGNLNKENNITSYVVLLSDVLRGEITLTAVFERDYVNLTVNATVDGVISDKGGSVAIILGDEGQTKTELLLPEKSVTIYANKKSGYKFIGWYDNLSSGQLVSADDKFTFDMPLTEIVYYARFKLSYWYEYRSVPKGDGTEENPYIINTPNELAWLSYAVNTGLNFSLDKHAQLNSNIDLSEYMWEPIGNGATLSTTSKWQGVFDGQGYVISNMKINKLQNQVSYSGLFGSVYGVNAEVKNLGLENADLYSESTYNNYVGVVVGYLENGNIYSCYVTNSTVNAFNEGGSQYIGLVAGANTKGTIKNSYAKGYLSAKNTSENKIYMGAIVGNNYGSGANIENCYSSTNLEVNQENDGKTSIYVGALVGYNSINAILKNSFYNIDIQDITIIGVNNAVELNSKGKTLNELAVYSTYVNDDSSWNFNSFWLLPQDNVNEGMPILRGVGNLIVNSTSSEGGKINPSGQNIYFTQEGVPVYYINPNKNYRILSVSIDGVKDDYYSLKETSQSYKINKAVGNISIEAEFEKIPKEPINPIYIIVPALILGFGIVSFLVKYVDKKTARKRRLRAAVKNYKKNRYKR